MGYLEFAVMGLISGAVAGSALTGRSRYVIAALSGWLAERGWDGGRVGLAFAAMLIGHALCLLLGGAWLAASIGLPKALAAGVLPFIPGALLKSALGAGLLKAIAVMRAPPTA